MARKIVDLTLTFAHGKSGVDLEPQKTLASDGFNTTTLHIYSHALTHMDATKHFLDDGLGIEHNSLDKCIGDAVVIDLSHKLPNSFITVADIESVVDDIQAGSRVLLRTDWATHADYADYRTQFPRISVELAQWLADKGIWLVGVETPSVASLLKENLAELAEVHQILLSANIIIIEGLCNLRQLPNHVHFVALPLKLEDCDGSPIRAIAIINEN